LFNYTSLVTFYEGDMLPFFYDYFDVLFSGWTITSNNNRVHTLLGLSPFPLLFDPTPPLFDPTLLYCMADAGDL
jgi:hypothetical protein